MASKKRLLAEAADLLLREFESGTRNVIRGRKYRLRKKYHGCPSPEVQTKIRDYERIESILKSSSTNETVKPPQWKECRMLVTLSKQRRKEIKQELAKDKREREEIRAARRLKGIGVVR